MQDFLFDGTQWHIVSPPFFITKVNLKNEKSLNKMDQK
jgi:hypothetical protein